MSIRRDASTFSRSQWSLASLRCSHRRSRAPRRFRRTSRRPRRSPGSASRWTWRSLRTAASSSPRRPASSRPTTASRTRPRPSQPTCARRCTTSPRAGSSRSRWTPASRRALHLRLLQPRREDRRHAAALREGRPELRRLRQGARRQGRELHRRGAHLAPAARRRGDDRRGEGAGRGLLRPVPVSLGRRHRVRRRRLPVRVWRRWLDRELWDYGQTGTPANPCGDPPGTVGSMLTPPTSEGGRLRVQDLRTPAR